MTIDDTSLPTTDIFSAGCINESILTRFKAEVIANIERTEAGREPFRHLYIEHILPPSLYEALRTKMLQHKYKSTLQARLQDNQKFVNKRFSLVDLNDVEVQYIHAIFSDKEVKLAFLRQFFLDVTPEFAESLRIHEEFEYVYTQAGRFQNIHVDIPPKLLSFVFYFPEFKVSEEAEQRNATVLYDKTLEPHYVARYRPNSVCVFAPHFHSYHGFASTIDREVLVMFYVSPDLMARWRNISGYEAAPFTGIRDVIEDKLTRYPLIEYGRETATLRFARDLCLINAPQGRVMKEVVSLGNAIPSPSLFSAVASVPAPATFSGTWRDGTPCSINKVIWICWFQGWENAPWLVRKCLSSWQQQNPEWDIRTLDRNSVQRYIELPDLGGKTITAASMSDIIRILLLHEYGGVWVDATLLCHQPLDTWLPDAMCEGFFAFDSPGWDRPLSSWFIAAEEGHSLIAQWHAAVLQYWHERNHAEYYFWFHYLFADLCESNLAFRETWQRVPKISASGPITCNRSVCWKSAKQSSIKLCANCRQCPN